ncbi:hypothetical protein KAR91_11310 [Candidatus Pacearchaeota archaeon]|nr:hypothetical protein [Candidatus Pacearchaeota archaeon]
MEEILKIIDGIKDKDTNEILNKVLTAILVMNEQQLKASQTTAKRIKRAESITFVFFAPESTKFESVGKGTFDFAFDATEVFIMTSFVNTPPDLLTILTINNVDYPTIYFPSALSQFEQLPNTVGFVAGASGDPPVVFNLGMELKRNWTVDIKTQNTRGESAFVFLVINGWRYD